MSNPVLSVVVPIYNVERYLDECLQSLATQEVNDIEVIMVDDGSTDSSADIGARWVEKDARFSLVRQDNHGLGHARNTGAAHVAGTYLAFLDSDDVVPADAYRRMMDVLEQTGSDFATGNVHRFDSSGRTWQAPLYKGMAKVEERATHVTRNHDLLRDHLAHNKMWRTSFWRQSGLSFPVGVLYEDVPTTIPAHVMARAVDVVPVVAVLWRVRDQGDSSITQSRGQDVRHLRDRVDGALRASRFIAERGDQDLKDAYDFLVLRRDLRWYVDLYPEVDAEYQDETFTAIGRYLAQVSPEALRRTPVAMRIAYALLARGARQDFAAYVDLRRAGMAGDLPVSARGGRALVEADLPRGSDLPDEARDVTEELRVVSRTSRITVSDRDLVLEGWAYIPRLPIEEPVRIQVWLDGNGRSLPAAVVQRSDERAALDVGAPQAEAGRVAFVATVPLRKLRRRWRRGGAEWPVTVAVTSAGITKTGPLATPQVGAAERPIMAELGGGQWLRVCWTDDGLTCRVRTGEIVVTNSEVVGDSAAVDQSLMLTIRTTSPPGAGAAVRLRSTDLKASRDYPVTRDGRSRRSVQVRIPVADLADDAETGEIAWNLLFRTKKGDSWQRVLDPVGLFGRSVQLGDRELALRRSRAATVDVVCRPFSPSVTGVRWHDEASFVVRMALGGRSIGTMALKARQHEERVRAEVVEDGDSWKAFFPVGALARFGDSVPIRAGTWDLVAETDSGDVPLRIGHGLLESLPAVTDYRRRRYILTDRRRHVLSLVVESELDLTERGPQNQRRLRTLDYPGAKTHVRDVVLYESYYGKQFSDSPRQVFDQLCDRDLGLQHLVAVRDQQVNVPDGATAVVYRSREYYQALAQARYVVANTHLPNCFERADGQVVLQTWHGVGTKKIGLDMETVSFANKSYLHNIRGGEAENWSYLVSPNPFTSAILTRAFAYGGPLLETGVPRNDIFHRPDRSEVAARVKAQLGIPPGKKVVMYAPTWRDNVFDGPGRYRLDLRFDLYEAARKLGEEYVILFRKHSNIVDRLPPGNGAVVDVSDYPDVQELLLVSDILISDYSTLMCDFANTGRPMLFYTYDLANYRDVLRGFYFDFENEVPGPLITNEGDLLPAILDAESIRADYDAKYRAFVERFCPWDDGNAATRVVDAVFGVR